MDANVGIGSFGKSLKVDNMQDLAERMRSEIPQRYVRHEREEEIIFGGDGEDSTDEMPVIDFSRLFEPEFTEAEAAKLHSACVDWGFFQLVNHGVPEVILQNFKHDMEEFFKLPLEERQKCDQLPGQLEGYGQAFVHSETQKLDWADMLYIATFPSYLKKLQFWPTNPPSCRESIEEYSSEVKRVADSLLKVMSKKLGPAEKIYEMFKDGTQSFRFNYYPSCPSPEKVFGITPHSDPVGLTVLLQMDEVNGLQIRKNNGWVLIKPLPGAFIINIGDIIEILSNGKYKSIEHRAIVNNGKKRQSVAAFHSLKNGDMVEPIPELLNGKKPLYKSLQFEEYMKMVFSRKLEGKGILGVMKLDDHDLY